MMKPNIFITSLIIIGKDESFYLLPALINSSEVYSSGQFMRESRRFWIDIAIDLTAQEIRALIKTLTVVERDIPEMKAGSVSPVIWLYKYLRQEFPGEYDEIEEWILQHTDNDYLPWGTSNLGARSLDEFKRLSGLLDQERQDRKTSEEKRQAEARQRRAERATQNLSDAIRRKDKEAIIALRSKGADVNAEVEPGKSAFDLAWETGDGKIIEALIRTLAEETSRNH